MTDKDVEKVDQNFNAIFAPLFLKSGFFAPLFLKSGFFAPLFITS